MLQRARELISKNDWKNITLVRADVTRFMGEGGGSFDAGVCTLGMSVIPDPEKAYTNLLSHVHPGGEIIIGDIQAGRSWRSVLNPLVNFWAKEYGGSAAGHQNARQLFDRMEKELGEVRRMELRAGVYCYCIGKKVAADDTA
jgi:demethylmenaquinone methyltransferase/2-methoxy-6-polyprenyl-1,4-benzoquinol methylase